MYFPYLRARQFELIALRELVAESALREIVAVIEPVKESMSNLNLAHKVFVQYDYSPYLIMNPLKGEKRGDSDFYLNYLQSIPNVKFKPAFHYSDNINYILQSIEQYNLKEVLIICLENFSDEDGLKRLINYGSVSHIMLLEPHKYRSLDRYIKSLNKFYIRLDDLFEKQQKNSDFLNIPAHKLSEEHLYYDQDNYQGFSDFTVLTSEYVEGGSTPRAVVIHLSYINVDAEDQIWIRHFTSKSNDSTANVQGKFAEAAEKAVNFCNEFPLQNAATVELEEYFVEARYPGLGTVKKISIKNHLLIVGNYLD
jgi:hypothetical protein